MPNWYYPNASDYNATPGNHYYPQGLKLAAKDRTDSKTSLRVGSLILIKKCQKKE